MAVHEQSLIAGTGEFATADEMKAIKSALKTLTHFHAGRWPSPAAIAHSYALAHGLPNEPGYYSIDLQTSEFIKK